MMKIYHRFCKLSIDQAGEFLHKAQTPLRSSHSRSCPGLQRFLSMLMYIFGFTLLPSRSGGVVWQVLITGEYGAVP